MKRSSSMDAKKQEMDRLIAAYGNEVLAELRQITSDNRQIESAYYRTFLSVFNQLQSRYGRKQLQKSPRFTIQATTVKVVKRVLAEESPSLPGEHPANEAGAVSPENGELDNARLIFRLEQLLRAAMIESEASRHHRGPVWTSYAVALTLVIGVSAVIFGAYQKPEGAVAASADNIQSSGVSASFPPPLSNLPVHVRGQLLVSSGASLQHVGVTKDAVYVSSLTYKSKNAIPHIAIYQSLLQSAKLKTDGVPYLEFDLQSPAKQPHIRGDWKLRNWSFQITGDWGVVTATWSTPEFDGGLTQLYLIDLPTKMHALAKSWVPQADGANAYTVAVGAGKVAVQGQLPSTSGSSSPAGLPVKVYEIRGTSPAHALVKWKTLSNVPGQLVHPDVVKTGIVSQGIVGQSASSNGLNAIWYVLDWQGNVSKQNGPPVDGRPHWAVESPKSGLWWVETTPSSQKKSKHALQVLMGTLTDPSTTDQPPALSLSGTVEGFHIANGYMEWIQNTQKVPQLVVAQVE
ncbi:hypothetical protein [Alicyclobacillus sp. SO9]|uniref:hypothetical protein n=1 Tax=Alicyclobacillus sp. SO9 TaxID=2665646 RepID=UPI0018E79B07|nr:hypothetical protein [Alicyclobacillus sp. SO9]QQE77042.1 hypothetical protein GI364_13745 [Alicyclobacillus sp. SO9]